MAIAKADHAAIADLADKERLTSLHHEGESARHSPELLVRRCLVANVTVDMR
ncbi:Hypothetical protein A7982_03874 [Minicystis rosea]|nr:Hypothetical protein A7982_03874 [Minicystis rosea]